MTMQVHIIRIYFNFQKNETILLFWNNGIASHIVVYYYYYYGT